MAPLMLRLVALLAFRGAAEDGDDVCTAGSSCKVHHQWSRHFWSSRSRNAVAASSTPHTAPTDFSNGPTWVWPNAFDEQTRHSPLIDEEKSIYITGGRRLRKFSPDGALLWTYGFGLNRKSSTSPALYKDKIYVLTVDLTFKDPIVSGLDLKTGSKTWMKTLGKEGYSNGDATSILVYNDTIYVPTRDHVDPRPVTMPTSPPGSGEDGNNQITAVGLDGNVLWEYTLDEIVWNFIFSPTGDGDIMAASTCGRVWRVTSDGKLRWAGGRQNPGAWCGCGGGVAGPNGIFYSVFNDFIDARGPGVVQALRMSDGALLWEKYFGRFAGWQYPAVGNVGGQLAVVAAMGGITGPPNFPLWNWQLWLPSILKKTIWSWYTSDYEWVGRLLLLPGLPNAIVNLDPLTGEERWRYVEKEWHHIASKNDEQGWVRRLTWHIDSELMCLPDPQGIPLIAGDGTVYGSSSHNGDLTAIKDKNNNGIIEPEEVSTFVTNAGFLNSPSLAPGMLVAAPCHGPVYVFKS